MSNFITTYTGKHIDPMNPDPEMICIADIAHALSLLCRGNGHVHTFWSVAQHCICCAKEAEMRGLSYRMALACLLHDASECYLSDVPRPFKQQLPEYQQHEDHLLSLIYQKFLGSDLNDEERAQLKEIDNAMLWYDLENLLGEMQFGEVPQLHLDLDYTVQPFETVEDKYLNLFAKYSGTEAPSPVYLEDIVDAFEMCSDEWTQFLNRSTGKIVSVPDDSGLMTEEDAKLMDEIEESSDYIRLPNQYELHEKGIMEEFAELFPNTRTSNALIDALNRPHPYRRFKDMINQFGCAQQYYAYRSLSLMRKAEEWCKENQVQFRRKPSEEQA